MSARALLSLVALLAILAGCGGDSRDDDRKDTDPVDCKARPETCR